MSFIRSEVEKNSKSEWCSLSNYRYSVFYKCAKELKEITNISIEIDHADSLKNGGAHHPDNMWPLPKNINRTKGAQSWPRLSFEAWKDWFKRRVDIDSELLGEYNPKRFNETCYELEHVWCADDAKALHLTPKKLQAQTSKNIEYILDNAWEGFVLIAGIKVYLNIVSDKNVTIIIPRGSKLSLPDSNKKNTGIASSCIRPTKVFAKNNIIIESNNHRVLQEEITFQGSILKVFEFIVARDASGKLNCYEQIKDLNGITLTELLNPFKKTI